MTGSAEVSSAEVDEFAEWLDRRKRERRARARA